MSQMQIMWVQGFNGSHLAQCPIVKIKPRTLVLESLSVIPGKWEKRMHINYSCYKTKVDGVLGMVITIIGIKITWSTIQTWIKSILTCRNHLMSADAQKCIIFFSFHWLIFGMNVDVGNRYTLPDSVASICYFHEFIIAETSLFNAIDNEFLPVSYFTSLHYFFFYQITSLVNRVFDFPYWW